MYPPGLTPSVKVDWNGNGFGVGAYDDITSHIESGMGKNGVGAGSATFVLVDPDQRYWPNNGASPLVNLLLPGKKVRATVTYGGTEYPLFAGFIRRISPSIDSSGVARVALVCEDHLSFSRRRKVSLSMLAFQSAGSFRRDILDAIGWTSAKRDLTYCPEDDMIAYAHAGGEEAFDLLEELNEATGTRHFMKAGPDETDWYKYVARDRMHGLDGAVADTWTDSDIASISGLDISYDDVVNSIDADISPYVIQPTQDVWTHPRLPIVLAPSEVRKVYARLSDFTYPVGVLHKGRAAQTKRSKTRVRPPLVSGVQANVATKGTGGPVTVAVAGYGMQVRITLTNTSATSAEAITSLSLSGQPVFAVDMEDILVEDAASQVAYDVRAGQTLTSRFLSNGSQAEGTLSNILFRSIEPPRTPTLTMKNRFPRCINRQPLDIVAVTSASTYMDAVRFQIEERQWAFSKNGDWQTVYSLRQAPEAAPESYPFFKWGDVLGSSSSNRLGY